MNDVHVFSLYSGSTGNAFLFACGSDCFLIDAGKNAKRLCSAIRACGYDPDAVRAIFVTHEHSDHISALPVFLKKHPIPVHLCEGCAYKLANDPEVEPLLVPHPPIYQEQLGSFTITSFPTPHDSRASVGYRIEVKTEEETVRIGYATDIGYVSDEVRAGLIGCDAVILESNHDPDLLMLGRYPYDLKRRIASKRGHLSNPDSAQFASELCEHGTRAIMLAHLSQENNTPDTAYSEYLGTLGSERIKLCIAEPEACVQLI